MRDAYARAERFLSWNHERYVSNADIQHHWITNVDRFWYLRTTLKGGKEFVVVNAATGKRTPAFDQGKIAAGLSNATHTIIDPASLPFVAFSYTHDHNGIQFHFVNQLWTCGLKSGVCVAAELPKDTPGEVPSPDGTWTVFVRGYNLWLRRTADGKEYALTADGVEHYSYAGLPGDSGDALDDMRGKPTPPQVLWSPDSRFVLTHRLDERKVKDMYLIQSVPDDGSVRPKLYGYRYALPGDENVAELEPVVFDVGACREVKLNTPPLIAGTLTLVSAHTTWWSPDSTRIYYLNRGRFSKWVTLNVADPRSGVVTEILRESSDTWVRTADGSLWIDYPCVRTLSNGDVIWYSERDGWGHLYYYDARGRLRNQITRGDWVVRRIIRVDEASRMLYFMAGGRESGRDPYYQHLYSVNMDGSELRLLTPENAEHLVKTPDYGVIGRVPDALSSAAEKSGFSPSGRYFVYSYSRPDMPPVLALRTATGQLVGELETADISELKKGGYAPIEPFQVLAADGKTSLYGNIFRPSNFDPGKKYPVLDSVDAAPHVSRTWKSFSVATFDPYGAQDLAELGFIVVTVDGRGTPHRSRAFLDYCYGRISKASDLDDHIAAFRQLSQRYPYMDLTRVGVYGFSGGGYLSAEAILTHPEFYKVAVSSEGSQDLRDTDATWGETYNGPVNEGDYKDATNENFAANLTGKLLIMHGELDGAASPTVTLKMVDALIKANKDFDFLIIPGGHHGSTLSPYFIRRRWDYFVRNLLGAEPPAGYEIIAPEWVLQNLK